MNYPNVFGVIPGLDTPMKYLARVKSVNDGDISEKELEVIWFRAAKTPMNGQNVAIKPEGQRSWFWSEIFTKQELPPDALIEDREGVQYRVRSKNDWKRGGYFKYEVTEGFQ
jgi:hypothetical protein